MPNSTAQIHPPAEKKTLWAWTVATFFGFGLLKPGPGTYGSAATLAIWLTVAQVFHPAHLTLDTIIAAVAATLIGIPAATVVARESGVEDPGHVVIDEVAGQLVALAICSPDWAHAIICFLLFRLFDIVKPPPVGLLERLPEGTGIMLDDIAAGLYALGVFALIHLRY